MLPRLRYTPYYQVRQLPRDESDHRLQMPSVQTRLPRPRPLRDAILSAIPPDGHKVLCRMTLRIISRRAPARPAARRSAAVFGATPSDSPTGPRPSNTRATAIIVSANCHSPIIALSQGPDSSATHRHREGPNVRPGLGDWVFRYPPTTNSSSGRNSNRCTKAAPTRARCKGDDETAAIQKRMVGSAGEAIGERKAVQVSHCSSI